MDSFEDAVRIEAYAIYEVRRQLGLPGTELGDWINAERKIRTKQVDDILGTKCVYNRIKDLM